MIVVMIRRMDSGAKSQPPQEPVTVLLIPLLGSGRWVHESEIRRQQAVEVCLWAWPLFCSLAGVLCTGGTGRQRFPDTRRRETRPIMSSIQAPEGRDAAVGQRDDHHSAWVTMTDEHR